jgi:hypothetical protein
LLPPQPVTGAARYRRVVVNGGDIEVFGCMVILAVDVGAVLWCVVIGLREFGFFPFWT